MSWIQAYLTPKTLVALGVFLAAFGAIISPMNPTLAFYLMALSSSINAVSAYLGFAPPNAPPPPAAPIAAKVAA